MEQQIAEMAEMAEQQIAEMDEMAEQQIALERNKIPSLNLFPEEERKRIVQKIVVLTGPMLMDEDNNARIEGREIITDFAKAVGLATMIDVLRPDVSNIDLYPRNYTVICFSIVASTFGIPAMLPFLREICHSNRSWQARHTGARIAPEIAILVRSAALLLGSAAVLPHLESLKEIIEPHLKDENKKVRIASALAMELLTEAAAIRH